MRSGCCAVAGCLALLGVVGVTADAAAGVSGHTALPSGNKVYFGENGGSVISEAELNGSGGTDMSVGAGTVNQETGTALDPATSTVYWIDYGSDQIWSANLDGTGGAQVLYQGGAEDVDGPNGIAIDPATNKIYWTNMNSPLANTIYEANLDGSGGVTQLDTTGITVTNPQGLAIDPADNKIFWGNLDQIGEANLDDTGDAQLITPTGSATHNQIVGVAVDPATNKLYWSNAGASAISYANLDGTDSADLNTGSASAPDGATGVAIDPANNKIYWTDKFDNKISYANLDDTGGGGNLDTGNASVEGPNYPALLEAPTGTGVPSLSGSTAADSTLTCGQGTWAVDFPGGQLYQAPETFTYTWTRNGSPVSGATQRTLVASSGGIYSCAVTARNDAGSRTQQSSSTITVSSPSSSGPPSCTLKPNSKTETVTAAKRGLKLTARCSENVSAKLASKVSAVLKSGKHKTFKLTAVSKSLGAGKSTTLTVKLSSAALNALKQGATESVSFTLKATNAHGSARAGATINHVKLKRTR